MGSVLGGMKFEFNPTKRVEPMEVLEASEVRRRNSLASYIAQFITFEGDDYTALVDKIKEEKFPKKEGKPMRVSSKSLPLNCHRC